MAMLNNQMVVHKLKPTVTSWLCIPLTNPTINQVNCVSTSRYHNLAINPLKPTCFWVEETCFYGF